MAFQRERNGNRVFHFYQKRANYSNEQMAKILNITTKTFKTWQMNPQIIRLKDLFHVCGIFGITVEEFVYVYSRNLSIIPERGKWYLLEQYEKGDKVLSKINEGK
jgi:DNA-binding XRE family transcriptional regulator